MPKFQLSDTVNTEKIFLVNLSEVEGRLDPYYYGHIFKKYEKEIKANNYTGFGSLIKSLTNGFDFRNYKTKGTPYLKVANIKKGEFDFSKIQYIDLNSSDISKNIQLKKGNLLLTRKGTYGNAIALDKDYDYVISSEVFYIELKKNTINPKFLEIFFNINIGQYQFDKNKIGAIMGSLSQEAIRSLIIPLPHKTVQQQIVDKYETAYTQKQQKKAQANALLDSIDDYLLNELGITLPEKDNSLKNRMFTTNIKEVSGNRHNSYYYLPYYDELEDSLSYGKYPLITLKNVVKKINRQFLPIEGVMYNYIQLGSIGRESSEVINPLQISCPNIPSRAQQVVKKGEMLFSIANPQWGVHICIRPENDGFAASSGFIILNSKQNNIFIIEVLRSSIYRELYNKYLVGAGLFLNISEKNLLSISIPFPLIDKQNEIANHISKIRAQAKQLEQEAKEILEKAKQEVERMILGSA